MNVYLCQFSENLEDNIYLPYTAGMIVSYLKTVDFVKLFNYKILFIKEDIDKVLVQITEPDYVFFSVYIWNYNYSMAVAKAIKEKYPNCKVVLGGHHVPFDCRGFFEANPFINIIVHGEGEIICGRILSGDSLFTIENIAFNKLGHTVVNKVIPIDHSLDILPSPYLTGIFDDILDLPYEFTASLETNRGCPFGCAYCDWGNCKTSKKKLRFFDKERVLKEIEWFGKNKIGFLFGCDSNFGIVPQDMEYIDALIATKRKYGYPKKFRVCYTKNSDDVVYDMNLKLNEDGMSKGATLSLQSLNDEALKAVKRVNINRNTFKRLLSKYNYYSIPTYTEMILGLPKETFESFKNGLCELLEMGQHSSIVIYLCQVYPNSEINAPRYRKEYGLKTVKVPMYLPHTNLSFKEMEIEENIIETDTMSNSEFVETCMFSWLIQTFHCLGITQYISKYLRLKHGVSYYNFYTNLKNEILTSPDTLLNHEYIKVQSKYRGLQYGEGLYYLIDETGNFNWTLEEGSFLNLIKSKDTLYSEIYRFMCNLGYPKFEILKLNKFLIREYDKGSKNLLLDGNFLDILKTLNIYHNLRNCLTIKPKKEFKSFKEYAIETIWYGRKGGQFFYNGSEIV